MFKLNWFKSMIKLSYFWALAKIYAMIVYKNFNWIYWSWDRINIYANLGIVLKWINNRILNMNGVIVYYRNKI